MLLPSTKNLIPHSRGGKACLKAADPADLVYNQPGCLCIGSCQISIELSLYKSIVMEWNGNLCSIHDSFKPTICYHINPWYFYSVITTYGIFHIELFVSNEPVLHLTARTEIAGLQRYK